MRIKLMVAAGIGLALLGGAAPAASLQRAPVDGGPGIVRIFVPASEVSTYQALGYQLIDYVPSPAILQAYLDLMCDPDPSDTGIAPRFGVGPSQLCASARAAIAEEG